MGTSSTPPQPPYRRLTSYRWAWIAVISLVLAVLAAMSYGPAAPAAGAAWDMRIEPAAFGDAAVQSVLSYLRAHSGAELPQPTPAKQDAAQQAVMRYVRAHEPVATPGTTGWDAITQAVLDYLGAHSHARQR